MKWNDIPWDENAPGEVKGLEFDLQIVENGGTIGEAPEYTKEDGEGHSEGDVE